MDKADKIEFCIEMAACLLGIVLIVLGILGGPGAAAGFGFCIAVICGGAAWCSRAQI